MATIRFLKIRRRFRPIDLWRLRRTQRRMRGEPGRQSTNRVHQHGINLLVLQVVEEPLFLQKREIAPKAGEEELAEMRDQVTRRQGIISIIEWNRIGVAVISHGRQGGWPWFSTFGAPKRGERVYCIGVSYVPHTACTSTDLTPTMDYFCVSLELEQPI